MFTRSKNYSNSNNVISPDRFIEVIDDINDIANSQLLYMLDQETERLSYTITRFEHRIDLIANEIYGSEKYSWVLLYLNRISVSDLTRHTVLRYIPIDRLKVIIQST